VLEIDAASNRGIDEMRELRERVKFLPASLRRKVYIIDEAHMLTTEAWNAFLKTLEEPPPHVLFILATTEPHKVPETVRSRLQRFDFRRVPTEAIAAHLARICSLEGAQADADALGLVAEAGQGSVRDALSVLDQKKNNPAADSERSKRWNSQSTSSDWATKPPAKASIGAFGDVETADGLARETRVEFDVLDAG